MLTKMWDEISHPFPYFAIDVLTYPCMISTSRLCLITLVTLPRMIIVERCKAIEKEELQNKSLNAPNGRNRWSYCSTFTVSCLHLTLKWLGHFFQNVISFSDAIHLMCISRIWNWSNTMNVSSALWILMAWCFSTRASVATVLTMHPCISQCLRVNEKSKMKTFWLTLLQFLTALTIKKLSNIFQNIILFSNIVPYNSNISVWIWSNTMNM